jgi:hypothetical protein
MQQDYDTTTTFIKLPLKRRTVERSRQRMIPVLQLHNNGETKVLLFDAVRTKELRRMKHLENDT